MVQIHEELASLIGIYEYFMALYKHHYNNDKLSIREKVQKVNKLIADHEKEIANPILRLYSQ